MRAPDVEAGESLIDFGLEQEALRVGDFGDAGEAGPDAGADATADDETVEGEFKEV